MLIFIGAALSSAIWSLNSLNLEQERIKKTNQALATTKNALIAWSVSRGQLAGNERPGELPCPDTSAPGSLNYGNADANCTAGKLGRVPWRKLGIEEPLDGWGEPLWYAIDGAFRVRPSNNQAINSDTRATLVTYDTNESTLLNASGQEYAALLFSPGPALANQDRSATTSASAYLDTGLLLSNAIAGGPFVRGPIRDVAGNTLVNDHILGITAQELVSAVEKRVLREVSNLLANFANANGGKYPNPAPATCTLTPTPLTPNTCNADSGKCFGRLPEDVLPTPPNWFTTNGWGRVIIYAINKSSAMDGSAAECSPNLTLNGSPKTYVLLSSGTPLGAIIRPSASITDYQEAAGNLYAWNSGHPNQRTLVSPTGVSQYANDQVLSYP